jgi:pyruvate ferredoxin oxidoreductase beta subunit
MTQTFLRERIPPGELVAPGQAPCPGCGVTLALRLVLKALGPQTVVAMPARCADLGVGPSTRPTLRVPLHETQPGETAAVAAAVRAGLDARGDRETVVLAWAGDAATFDTGLGALSGAAERDDDILYVCADHEARMSAGIRGGTATPWGTWSAAGVFGPADAVPPGAGPTRGLRLHPAKDLIGILAAHRIPYAATATVAHPVDLIEKVQKAQAIRGTRFLHVLAPCPPLWGCSSAETIDLARAAVRNRIFPLYEVEDGLHWRLTADHPGEPVEPYLMRQERLRHLSAAQIRLIQADVDARWEILQRRVQHGV